MAQTQYPHSPGAVNDANFQPNPKTRIDVVSQGKESKPIPTPSPSASGLRPLKQAPTPVTAPGIGTI